jgi:NTE family protein
MIRILFLICSLFLTGCGSHFIIPEELPEPEPLPCFNVPKKIRVALVLGSGGVRGMAHVGVIQELEKAGVPIDLIVGCSAGSFVGALYADKSSVDQIYDSVWRLRRNSLLDIDIWNCRFGLSHGNAMLRVLARDLCAKTFEELKIPLVIVASDLYTGELVPLGSGDLIKAVRASCSIPFVFTPCNHLGRVLVDGGVVDPLPVKVAYDLGAEIIIAVDLSELMPKTYPRNLFQVANRSAEIAFLWQSQESARLATVVIRPRTCGIGCFDDSMKEVLYVAGKEAAIKELPLIYELLEKQHLAEEEDVSYEYREVSLSAYGLSL